MGADETASQSDSIESEAMRSAIEEQLDHGWRIVSLPDGQLLLSPPPRYGEPPA